MHPILAKFGSFTIYSYGVMAAIGFALATLLVYRNARRMGLAPNRMLDLMIVLLVSGIIGARIFYVLLNLGYYSANPLEIPNLSRGGLVWYGGFIAALGATILFIRKNSMDFWNVGDLIVPYIALGQVFGRIGCFLNGCCYGIVAPQDYPFAVHIGYDPALRHPTQIYSAIALLVMFGMLQFWQHRKRFAGEIFLGYCILYSLKRFLVEFLRGDNPKVIASLITVSQAISLAVFFLAILFFAYRVKSAGKKL